MSYSKRRSTPNEIARAEIATHIRGEEGVFSAASLVDKYGLDPGLTLQVVQKLFSGDILRPVDPKKWPDCSSHIKMGTEMKARDFEDIRAEGVAYNSWRGRPNYLVKTNCSRCNSMINGKGRHRKSARGHTKEECDLAMVKSLHQE